MGDVEFASNHVCEFFINLWWSCAIKKLLPEKIWWQEFMCESMQRLMFLSEFAISFWFMEIMKKLLKLRHRIYIYFYRHFIRSFFKWQKGSFHKKKRRHLHLLNIHASFQGTLVQPFHSNPNFVQTSSLASLAITCNFSVPPDERMLFPL